MPVSFDRYISSLLFSAVPLRPWPDAAAHTRDYAYNMINNSSAEDYYEL